MKTLLQFIFLIFCFGQQVFAQNDFRLLLEVGALKTTNFKTIGKQEIGYSTQLGVVNYFESQSPLKPLAELTIKREQFSQTIGNFTSSLRNNSALLGGGVAYKQNDFALFSLLNLGLQGYKEQNSDISSNSLYTDFHLGIKTGGEYQSQNIGLGLVGDFDLLSNQKEYTRIDELGNKIKQQKGLQPLAIRIRASFKF